MNHKSYPNAMKGKHRPPEFGQRISEMNSGENNGMWKGVEIIGRASLHQWVRAHLPAPSLCELCGLVQPRDLMNITGIYNRDFSNWQYACRKCHMRTDGRLYNLRNFKEVRTIR